MFSIPTAMILMKVKNLIIELEGFNPEADVCLNLSGLICSEDIILGYISESISGVEETPKTTKMVFIEGADYCE